MTPEITVKFFRIQHILNLLRKVNLLIFTSAQVTLEVTASSSVVEKPKTVN